MDGNATTEKIALVLRVALGAWFLYSGGEKIFGSGLDQFTQDVGNYKMVAAPWDAIVAYIVPWLEIIAGVCLMLGLVRKGAILVTTGLVLMFATAIGWAWAHGLEISCGCRGSNAPIHYWGKTFELAGYLLVLGFLAWADHLHRDEVVAPEPA
ncbi:MAG: DoxX family protein [Verrucomicrobiota bacterium]